jgi:phosphatidylserine/phosphatidylglycerophosphate/cardiolipin synthase-like enzyme
VQQLSSDHVDTLATGLAHKSPAATVLDAVPLPGYRDAAAMVLAAMQSTGTDPAAAAAHLRALAEGYALGRSAQHVEVVWSGPKSSAVPVRSTAQVLTHLVNEARHELILMTYSAWPYPPLGEAIAAAVAREVAVMAVVETLAGARGALAGEEPAVVFLGIPGVQVWHWPTGRRPEQNSKMHAKLAVADSRALLITSANLTQSGISKNIEAGLLVRGGPAPSRAAEHIRELQSLGTLERMY